jgi:hypothetical protein
MKYLKNVEDVIETMLLKELGKKINFEKGLEILLLKVCLILKFMFYTLLIINRPVVSFIKHLMSLGVINLNRKNLTTSKLVMR